MKPKAKPTTNAVPLIATMRLDLALDLDRELVRLVGTIPWETLAEDFGPLYCADNGRPGIPIRLKAGLHFLKHLKCISDEQRVRGWTVNPHWQFSCGEQFFQYALPIDPSQMTRWRQRIGDAGVERLLRAALTTAQRAGVLPEDSLDKAIVDTLVQLKVVEHPKGVRLYRKVHAAMLRIAQQDGISLRQGYRKQIVWSFLKHGGHAKAKHFTRACRVLCSLNTMTGRVMRDVERKMDDTAYETHQGTMILAELTLTQMRFTKGKACSLHAPEVERIAKAKPHKPYECGVKARQAFTYNEGFVVGVQSCLGNPFDGHTLEGQLDQVERITYKVPSTAFLDRGYKDHGVPGERIRVLIIGTRKLGASLKRHLHRRAAVEPAIGHMKNERLLGRDCLKGMEVDAMNAVLCSACQNLWKLQARARFGLCDGLQPGCASLVGPPPPSLSLPGRLNALATHSAIEIPSAAFDDRKGLFKAE